jgi:hypothetical protein
MKKDIALGQVPYLEMPALLGEPEYRRHAIRACQAYLQAIRNYLGPEPEGALLAYRGVPHPSGTSYEVVCQYETDLPEALDYAWRCVRQRPATWVEGGVNPPLRAAASRRRA